MALIYFNGFDHYNSNGDITYDNRVSTGLLALADISSITRFNTGRSLEIDGNTYVRFNLNQEYTTLVVGFAWRASGYNTADSIYCLSLVDDNNDVQLEMYANEDAQYRFSLYRGERDKTGVFLDKNTDFVWNIGAWYYLELKVTVHDTTGSYELRKNGTTLFSGTGVDTKFTSESGIKSIEFSYLGSAVNYDDLYIDDTDFLGDVRVKTFYPDSDGTHSDFTRNTGSNDYECVDDSQPNDDTDYIEADTVGNKSTFGITTGSLSTVKGINIRERIKKTDAGSRQARTILRSNGTDYNGSTEDLLDSWMYFQTMYLTDPDDSNAWNQTKLEAAEFGLEIVT